MWQKVKIILETDFSARSFKKVVLVELTAPPVSKTGDGEESYSPDWSLQQMLLALLQLPKLIF